MAASAESLVRKTVTVLFCDVVGSTSLGERIDPETTRRVMMRYFDEARAVLERHGGRVEKFIGDAVVAVFGVPVLHEDDALRAVRAADELRGVLGRLNEELAAQWGVQLEWRIGVNTGEAVVGDPAGTQTIASGDTVNVAARLQHAAQPGEILLGRETYRLVEDRVRAGPLTTFSLRGKAEDVKTWRLDEVRAGAERVFRRLASPLVGREEEQRALHDIYRNVLEEESCRLVTIFGVAGIGKTRFAQEVAARLFGATVAFGRCLPYGDGITFWPLIEIVRALGDWTAENPVDDARRRIAALLPENDESALVVDRVAGALGLTEGTRAEEAFWALRRLFEAVGRERPLVLVLEDVHWAEPTLLDFVEYLVGWSRGAPILILCLARPELLESRGSWPGTYINLEPLEAEEVHVLLANVLGSGGLDSSVEHRITAAADGNPLFLEELVRMLKDDGVLAQVDGKWVVAGGLEGLSIPPSINALLAARLDHLDPGERTVLQCAAVIGKQFWWSAVTELAPFPMRERVGTHLHALVRKRLIVPAETATFAGEDSFHFGHILVRDAAYATLPKAQRAQLHEQFARWLEHRTLEQPEIIGHHLAQAYLAHAELGPVDAATLELGARAGELLAAAGRRAFAREDMPASASLLTRATSSLPGGMVRYEALRELSAALWVLGQTARAEQVLDALLRETISVGDRRNEWYARLDRAGRRRDPVELESTAREALRVFEELGDDLGIARAGRRLAAAANRRCSFAEAEQESERALARAISVGDEQEEARIVDVLCTALLYGPKHAPSGIIRCGELLERTVGNRLMKANILCSLAGLEAMSGGIDAARASYQQARSLYEEMDLQLLVAGLSAISGSIELLAQNPTAAEEELRHGIELLGDGPYDGAIAYRSALLALALLAQGKRDAAAGVLGITPPASATTARIVHGIATARLNDDVGQAREAAQLAGETDALNLHADAQATLGELLAARGHEDEARSARQLAWELYVRKGNTHSARAMAGATQV
jgi:class 3 adenylate cyclase/tetratricopeptide (TPR) repeat protein